MCPSFYFVEFGSTPHNFRIVNHRQSTLVADKHWSPQTQQLQIHSTQMKRLLHTRVSTDNRDTASVGQTDSRVPALEANCRFSGGEGGIHSGPSGNPQLSENLGYNSTVAWEATLDRQLAPRIQALALWNRIVVFQIWSLGEKATLFLASVTE